MIYGNTGFRRTKEQIVARFNLFTGHKIDPEDVKLADYYVVSEERLIEDPADLSTTVEKVGQLHTFSIAMKDGNVEAAEVWVSGDESA